MADEKMAEEYTPSEMPGLGEIELVAGGGITEEDAVPTMPPPYPDDTNAGQVDTQEPGGGLTADDLAQPTSTTDTTGDRATGLTGMRG